eukprot:1160602-Pelagomonas_calceolata.AAC.11
MKAPGALRRCSRVSPCAWRSSVLCALFRKQAACMTKPGAKDLGEQVLKKSKPFHNQPCLCMQPQIAPQITSCVQAQSQIFQPGAILSLIYLLHQSIKHKANHKPG